MPMDKYAKRNNRSELWARRRNSTARLLLDRKLRHLEREWRIEQKQHKRDENRVKSDLRELENTDHYPASPPDRSFSVNRETVTPVSFEFESLYSESELKSRPSTGINEEEKINVLPETRFRTSALLPSYRPNVQGHDLDTAKAKPRHQADSQSSINSSSVSSIRPTSFHSKLVKASQSSCAGFFTSTPYRSVVSPTRGLEPQEKRGSGKRRVGCRFSSFESSTSKACEHFPCRTPLTYHSLGFRREDLNSSEENFDIEDRPRSSSSMTPSFLTQTHGMEKQERNKETSKSQYNRFWIEAHEVKGPKEFPRRIYGPPFEPAPVDTVFEKIRHGVEEKSINSAHVHARVGVHDRIRGLQQLVTEMKLRNESVKPPDWAINYGRRVPTRVLLNPVVPV